MGMASRRWAAELLHVWFHQLSSRDWFGRSDTVDALLRQRFSGDWHALRSRSACEFLTTPRDALAAILLFDQVPRNLFRDDPRAFASDPLARAITHGALARGWHIMMTRNQIQFLTMPLMHSEDIADQKLCLEIFARHVPGAFSFARSHHRMIARFGRFPHRNSVLERSTTEKEQRAIDAGFAW